MYRIETPVLISTEYSQRMAAIITNHNRSQSQLYTIRLWPEDLGNGQREIRVEVHHVLSGEVRYFRHGRALLEYLVAHEWTEHEWAEHEWTEDLIAKWLA